MFYCEFIPMTDAVVSIHRSAPEVLDFTHTEREAVIEEATDKSDSFTSKCANNLALQGLKTLEIAFLIEMFFFMKLRLGRLIRSASTIDDER